MQYGEHREEFQLIAPDGCPQVSRNLKRECAERDCSEAIRALCLPPSVRCKISTVNDYTCIRDCPGAGHHFNVPTLSWLRRRLRIRSTCRDRGKRGATGSVGCRGYVRAKTREATLARGWQLSTLRVSSCRRRGLLMHTVLLGVHRLDLVLQSVGEPRDDLPRHAARAETQINKKTRWKYIYIYIFIIRERVVLQEKNFYTLFEA